MTGKLAASRDSLVRARDAAEQAGQAKAEFLANMSHEIRTPMNAVLGLTYIVLRTTLTTRQRDYLEKIQGAGKSLLRLINDILDFSKIDAGKLELESEPFELDQVFDEVATALNAVIGDKPVELVVRRDEGVPNLLLGDALRLKQVLLNLSANAVKFTGQGEVCISAELVPGGPAQPSIRFAVRDTGVGISAESQRQLFRAFSQADSSTTRKHGGTGLGLAISQRIVALMGGVIDVQSSLGHGSSFSFSVVLREPATVAGPVVGAAERAGAARHMLKGLNALVVDDNYTARLTMTAMLRSFGMSVTDADSGRQALEVARASQAKGLHFAVALVDWRMPDLDGFAVVDALRAYDSLSSASFIMVSAYDRDVVEAAMPEHAPDGLLQKPVTPSTLLDTLYGVIVKGSIAAPAPQDHAPHVQLSGRVLLVEDNDINQLVAVELLGAFGLEVLVADDAAQALEQLKLHRFDAIVMDVQMPGMDGFEATGVIRAMPIYKDLPIIAMTANSLAGEREKCLAAGMSDYLSKPIEPELLAQCMARWIPAREAVAAA
jgi:two-component system sensor histidine kinase/response regulator